MICLWVLTVISGYVIYFYVIYIVVIAHRCAVKKKCRENNFWLGKISSWWYIWVDRLINSKYGYTPSGCAILNVVKLTIKLLYTRTC